VSERDETERQAQVGIERLVVLDECGSRINLTPLYGYAPIGQRLVQSVVYPATMGKTSV
jgi:hypothetical protein